MIFLPPLMAWRSRYHVKLTQPLYQVRGGKILLTALLIVAAVMISFGIKTTFFPALSNRWLLPMILGILSVLAGIHLQARSKESNARKNIHLPNTANP